jgi:hypothetical protein
MGDRRGAYRVLVGKPVGKKQLARPKHRWKDNIKMDLQEVGWGAWTGLIGLRKGTGGRHLKHSNKPVGSIKNRKCLH